MPVLNTVTVHGHFQDIQGNPATGVVTFVNDYYLSSTSTDLTFVPDKIEAPLDQNGEFWCVLPRTAGQAVQPEKWSYQVIQEVNGYSRIYRIELAAQTPQQVELSSLAPAGSGQVELPESYVRSIAGLTGDISASQIEAELSVVSPNAGDSAYEVWLQNGNTGTEAQFLSSLVGPTGLQGPQGVPGAPGAAGPQGLTGLQGPQGIPGTGFILQGHCANFAALPSGYGPSDAQKAVITDNDSHIWVWDGDSWVDGGPVGPQGPAGTTGATGATGPQGTPTTVNGKSGATITLTAADVNALPATSGSPDISVTRVSGVSLVGKTNQYTDITGIPAAAIPISQKAVANGVASLGSDGYVPASQINPSMVGGSGVPGVDPLRENPAGSGTYPARATKYPRTDLPAFYDGVLAPQVGGTNALPIDYWFRRPPP